MPDIYEWGWRVPCWRGNLQGEPLADSLGYHGDRCVAASWRVSRFKLQLWGPQKLGRTVGGAAGGTDQHP